MVASAQSAEDEAAESKREMLLEIKRNYTLFTTAVGCVDNAVMAGIEYAAEARLSQIVLPVPVLTHDTRAGKDGDDGAAVPAGLTAFSEPDAGSVQETAKPETEPDAEPNAEMDAEMDATPAAQTQEALWGKLRLAVASLAHRKPPFVAAYCTVAFAECESAGDTSTEAAGGGDKDDRKGGGDVDNTAYPGEPIDGANTAFPADQKSTDSRKTLVGRKAQAVLEEFDMNQHHTHVDRNLLQSRAVQNWQRVISGARNRRMNRNAKMKSRVYEFQRKIEAEYQQKIADAKLQQVAAKEMRQMQHEMTQEKVKEYQHQRRKHRKQALKRLRRGVQVKEEQTKLYAKTAEKRAKVLGVSTAQPSMEMSEFTNLPTKDQIALKAQASLDNKNASKASAPEKVAPLTIEMMTFRKLDGQNGKHAKESTGEKWFLNSQQQRFDMLVVDEKIAMDAGYKSPHLVLVSTLWNNATGEPHTQPTINLLNDAVLDEAADGHPIKFLKIDWNADQEMVLQQIRGVVTDGAPLG